MTRWHQDLQTAILAWPDVSALQATTDVMCTRIARTLIDARRFGSIQKVLGDLAPLIRQHLFLESGRVAQPVQLRVPNSSGWPTIDQWSDFSLNALKINERAFLINA